MNEYSIYCTETGVFTGGIISCGSEHLSQNIPEGMSCVLGEFDKSSQRVDLTTGEVVDYIPDQPSPNHQWDASVRRWIYVPTLEDKKVEKKLEINNICSALLGSIKASYPAEEVQTWSKQEQEARNYPESPTPLLSALAEARGISMDVLVQKVIEKADVFASISGSIIGKRQYCEKLVESATSKEEVALVMWEGI